MAVAAWFSAGVLLGAVVGVLAGAAVTAEAVYEKGRRALVVTVEEAG